MELIKYFLLNIIVFSGLIFGIFIVKICKEEIIQTSKYLITYSPFIVPISLGILIYQNNNLLSIISTILLSIMIFFLRGRYNPKTLYLSSGLIIYLATRFENIIIITIGVIIFCYSMFMITIDASNIKEVSLNIKNKKTNFDKILYSKIAYNYSYVILISIISYVLFEYLLKL
ncbi:MAG TPA: hypothetical protein V6C58_01155 [Allocoleopsis sp.]